MVSGNETPKSKGFNSQHYIAAVVEYYPNLGSNPLQSIQNNLPVYEDIIHNVSQYVSTIIVLNYLSCNLSTILILQYYFINIIIIFCIFKYNLS